MRDEDAADAASVTEKCSPEREERRGSRMCPSAGRGQTTPEIRLVTAGKQSVSKKPCVVFKVFFPPLFAAGYVCFSIRL